MSRKTRELTEEEEALWRQLAQSVRPRPKPRAGAVAPRAQTAPKPDAAAGAATTQLSPASAPARHAHPLPEPQLRTGEKRIRRGRVEISATLDLHGHTQASAPAALERFLRAAQARDARVVVVITGVGRAGEGILKRRLPDWLALPELRTLASGYAPAHRAHGGAGATYVFLRRANSS